MEMTREDVKAATTIVMIVGDAIKELHTIPSGVLYAQLCGHFDLATYQAIINALALSGVISVKNHIITYTGGL